MRNMNREELRQKSVEQQEINEDRKIEATKKLVKVLSRVVKKKKSRKHKKERETKKVKVSKRKRKLSSSSSSSS